MTVDYSDRRPRPEGDDPRPHRRWRRPDRRSGRWAPVGADAAGAATSRAATWSIGFASGDIPQVPLNQVLLNDRTVIGIDWGYWAGLRPEANAELLDELFAMVRGGRLRPAEPTSYRLDDAARGARRPRAPPDRGQGRARAAGVSQASRALRSCLRTLPNELWGSESTSSSCSGHFWTARPRLRQ